MSNRLKKILKILLGWRIWLFYKKKRDARRYTAEDSHTDKAVVYLLLTPEFNNIGDLAIAQVQREFLKMYAQDREIVEVGLFDTIAWLRRRDLVKPGDILALQGGGNFGAEYLEAEMLRRAIVSTFPDNRIISFPQTMDYRNTFEEKLFLLQSKRIYNRHKDLHLFSREKISYVMMKKAYPHVSVKLVPDIVLLGLGMEKKVCGSSSSEKRKKVLLCLRNDAERVMDDTKHEQLRWLVRQMGAEPVDGDMMAEHNVPMEERGPVINKKLEAFSESALVITDRLHGMIFAALMGKPTIVFSNYNHKVLGEYEMLEGRCPYIRIVDDENLKQQMEELLRDSTKYVPYKAKWSDYQPLIDCVLGL